MNDISIHTVTCSHMPGMPAMPGMRGGTPAIAAPALAQSDTLPLAERPTS